MILNGKCQNILFTIKTSKQASSNRVHCLIPRNKNFFFSQRGNRNQHVDDREMLGGILAKKNAIE